MDFLLDQLAGLANVSTKKMFESPRFLRRLNTLRGLSHEEDKQVLA
jgi:hypothetical protein